MLLEGLTHTSVEVCKRHTLASKDTAVTSGAVERAEGTANGEQTARGKNL